MRRYAMRWDEVKLEKKKKNFNLKENWKIQPTKKYKTDQGVQNKPIYKQNDIDARSSITAIPTNASRSKQLLLSFLIFLF